DRLAQYSTESPRCCAGGRHPHELDLPRAGRATAGRPSLLARVFESRQFRDLRRESAFSPTPRIVWHPALSRSAFARSDPPGKTRIHRTVEAGALSRGRPSGGAPNTRGGKLALP